MVEQAPYKSGVFSGDRDVEWRESPLVGKAMIGARIEEVFCHIGLAITNTVDKGRVVIHVIPHVNLCAMGDQDHRRFYVIVGGGHMQGGNVLAMDIRVGPGFKENRQNFRVTIIDRAIEGRVVLKVGPMASRLNVSTHTVDVPGFAGL